MIDTDDKLLDDITLKNVVILMICFIKYRNKFDPQLFLEEKLHDELKWQKHVMQKIKFRKLLVLEMSNINFYRLIDSDNILSVDWLIFKTNWYWFQ